MDELQILRYVLEENATTRALAVTRLKRIRRSAQGSEGSIYTVVDVLSVVLYLEQRT